MMDQMIGFHFLMIQYSSIDWEIWNKSKSNIMPKTNITKYVALYRLILKFQMSMNLSIFGHEFQNFENLSQ